MKSIIYFISKNLEKFHENQLRDRGTTSNEIFFAPISLDDFCN